jgi:hypothetical protein
MNTSNLLLHSFAFGTYLVITVLGYSSYAIYVVFKNKAWAWPQYQVAIIVWYFVSAVA